MFRRHAGAMGCRSSRRSDECPAFHALMMWEASRSSTTSRARIPNTTSRSRSGSRVTRSPPSAAGIRGDCGAGWVPGWRCRARSAHEPTPSETTTRWPQRVRCCRVGGVSRPAHQPAAYLPRRWLASLPAFRNRGKPYRNRRALPSEENRGHPRRALASGNVRSELSAWSCVDLPFPGCPDVPYQQTRPAAAARHRACRGGA